LSGDVLLVNWIGLMLFNVGKRCPGQVTGWVTASVLMLAKVESLMLAKVESLMLAKVVSLMLAKVAFFMFPLPKSHF
jgi:hypothetical protein